jgi:hypothetical protein
LAEDGATASRWASLDRRLALGLIMLLVAMLVAAAWGGTAASGGLASAEASNAAPVPQRANGDLILYEAIVRRVAGGDNYYVAAADELRRGNYPLKPFIAFRLPTLAVAGAWIGRPGLLVLQWCLFAGMLAAWWVRLDRQFADNGRRVSAVMLAAAGVAVAVTGRYLYLHEVWAGALIALSLALHRPGRWAWSVAVAALALAIRELALPYVLLMAALALWRRDWREAGAWAGITLLFAVAMWFHQAAVTGVVVPSDPPSPGWAALGGWAGMLRTFYLAGPLRWLPVVAAAPIIILSLFGWASWKSPTGLAATLMYSGYGLAFMLFGRANNFYWGLIVVPAFLVGLAFLPRAFSDLAMAVRRREAVA